MTEQSRSMSTEEAKGANMKFSNNLSDAQLERLAILSEELGEAQQAIGKIIRHGYDSNNPDLPRPVYCGIPTGNRQDLEKELGDVMYAIDALAATRDINGRAVSAPSRRCEMTEEAKGEKPHELDADNNSRIAFQLLASAFAQIADEDAREILGRLSNDALCQLREPNSTATQQEWRIWMSPKNARNRTWWRDYEYRTDSVEARQNRTHRGHEYVLRRALERQFHLRGC